MAKYKAKINYKKVPQGSKLPESGALSRTEMAAQNSPRAKALSKRGRHKSSGRGLFNFSKSTKRNLQKAALIFVGALLVAGVAGGLWLFSWIQELDSKLPSITDPFEEKEAASVIYDRNGKELFRVYNEFNRDPVNIDEIPYEVRWAFLAAEDVDFYTHGGFDAIAIARCAFFNISSGSTICGGSTVTQQTVKLTTQNDEVSIKRKLSELLMATKIEGAYSKDEILELYLTVVPFGKNVYGITAAADVYYGKEPKDLTVAEAAVLAGIINNPVFNSPTLAPDPEDGLRRSKDRMEYILGQMLGKKDKINAQHRANINDSGAEDLITEELITAAREEELKYKRPRFGFKPLAGHFIDYVNETLQQRNYKNEEEAFTATELQNGGYKIYTTLDANLQQIAERTVKNAANEQGRIYGASNAALVLLKPDNGHVLAMVGSKNYNGNSEGCNSQGTECRFDPQVNIATSNQSPGSTSKPHGYYEAYRRGLLYPGSFLPDIPVEIPGYSLKNWNGRVAGVGPDKTAREALRNSLNLPAIIVIEMIGVENFLNVMRDFGYTTYNDSSQFGASVILGGADVKPIEHAQGFGVFANGGDFVQHEVILRIEDRNGEVIYRHKPERERVANPQAVYLLNQTLNNNYNLANDAWGGNDIADKTGTSEENKDTWFAAYSPNIVALGWLGNNNNVPMSDQAFGSTSVLPWMRGFLQQISGAKYFSSKKAFPRPGNIIQGGGCADGCMGENVGLRSDFMIKDKEYVVDNIRQSVRVCRDQQNRLARPIDETLGFARDKVAIRYQLPQSDLQAQLDKWIIDNTSSNNQIPTEMCNRNRTGGNGIAFSPSTASNDVGGNSVRVSGSIASVGGTVTSVKAYFDFVDAGTGVEIGDVAVNADGSFDATLALPITVTGVYEPGKYRVGLVGADDQGGQAVKQLNRITLTSATTSNLGMSVVPGGPYTWGSNIGNGNSVTLSLLYTGRQPGAIQPGTVVVTVFKNGSQFSTVTLANSPGYSAAFGGAITNPGDGNTDTYTFSIEAAINNTGIIKTNGVIASPQIVVNGTP